MKDCGCFKHNGKTVKCYLHRTLLGGFRCMECGSKIRPGMTKCSKCGSYDIDIDLGKPKRRAA